MLSEGQELLVVCVLAHSVEGLQAGLGPVWGLLFGGSPLDVP